MIRANGFSHVRWVDVLAELVDAEESYNLTSNRRVRRIALSLCLDYAEAVAEVLVPFEVPPGESTLEILDDRDCDVLVREDAHADMLSATANLLRSSTR
jgi:hypothetical protein